MFQRYEQVGDQTKWELIQVRVSKDFKDRLKLVCKVNETSVSEITRAFWRAWITSEQVDPNPAPKESRFEWSFDRVVKYFRPKSKNSN